MKAQSRRNVWICGVVACGLALGVSVNAAAGQDAANPRHVAAVADGQLSDAQIVKLSLESARSQGESQPKKITWSVSTHTDSSAALGGPSVSKSEEGTVITVVIEGSFVTRVVHPKTRKPFTGNALILVVDSVTGEVRDFGMSPTVPDISKLPSPVSVTGPNYAIG